MRLSDIKTGESCVIVKILGHGSFRKRMMEMGFVRGKKILVEQNAPLRDPIKYRILDYEISLRRAEANLIKRWYASNKPPTCPMQTSQSSRKTTADL